MKRLFKLLAVIILMITIQGCAYYDPYVSAPPVSVGVGVYPNRGFYSPRFYGHPRYYNPMPFRGGYGEWGEHHGWMGRGFR